MKHRSGRVIGIFGLPCSGKSTIAKAVVNASRELIAYISTGDIVRKISSEDDTKHMQDGNLFPHEDIIRGEVFKLIEKRRSQGAEVIILDGFPRFDDQVKWMVENQYLGIQGDGCVIQIRGDELLKRAVLRNRNNQDSAKALQLKIQKHQRMINDMEKMIFYYTVPYFTVNNTDLTSAITQFTKYIGVRK